MTPLRSRGERTELTAKDIVWNLVKNWESRMRKEDAAVATMALGEGVNMSSTLRCSGTRSHSSLAEISSFGSSVEALAQSEWTGTPKSRGAGRRWIMTRTAMNRRR